MGRPCPALPIFAAFPLFRHRCLPLFLLWPLVPFSHVLFRPFSPSHLLTFSHRFHLSRVPNLLTSFSVFHLNASSRLRRTSAVSWKLLFAFLYDCSMIIIIVITIDVIRKMIIIIFVRIVISLPHRHLDCECMAYQHLDFGVVASEQSIRAISRHGFCIWSHWLLCC